MSEKKPSPHGWIILDKPRGLGSTQAVAAVKRNLREGGYAKTKVGHGGTLDPLAEGILPIALGEATKLAGRMLDASKIYDFTIQFGEETDTLDSEGEVVKRSDRHPRSRPLRLCLSILPARSSRSRPPSRRLRSMGSGPMTGRGRGKRSRCRPAK